LQDDLAQLYWSSTSDLTDAQPNDGKYPDGMMAQFRGLYEMNEDVAGWVYIPETEINYPVTLYADGYYRNHNFNDQYSVYGQPFFYENDTRDSIRQERVLIVRGNNTRDEQMFSPLLSYRRIAYLQENPIIEMNTLYDAAQWQIFAVSVVDEKEQNGHFDYTKREFADDAAFMQYAEQLQKRSLFRSDVTLTADDSLLLLVTNAEKEYGFSGARLIVAARRITGAEPMANYTINYQMTWPAAYRLYTTTRTVLTTTSTATTTTVVSTTTSTVSTSHTTSSVTSTSTSATVTQASEQTDTTTTLPQGPSDEGEETDDTENKDDDYLGN
jgi:SrtB family sortase